jgi:quercetin dioxygenase-like cupin family protein
MARHGPSAARLRSTTMRETVRLLPLSAALAALLCNLAAVAADAPATTTMDAGKLKWVDVPPVLPRGAKMALLDGDPGQAGPYTLRVKMPANYRIPAHWHTQAENLTVLSGGFYYGLGDKLDLKQAHELKTGDFHHVPGKTHHYAFTRKPTLMQVHSEGPFDMHYVNPADNPDKTAAK